MVIISRENNIVELRKRITNLSEELYSLANEGQTPRCRMFLETSAEVMDGINQAFDSFVNKIEK